MGESIDDPRGINPLEIKLYHLVNISHRGGVIRPDSNLINTFIETHY
ncbi:hypothetical protein ETAE_0841 [Edwardsiella piscicida]|uniref:Uncharacterized protein n=1 Tax=Edwardsiella piscicida TaxID=1263550 RepID=A0AAU8P320_EDWPI|nr:hypothetical protein ETAE_0841 [Edwardsiella tarda EIB202]